MAASFEVAVDGLFDSDFVVSDAIYFL